MLSDNNKDDMTKNQMGGNIPAVMEDARGSLNSRQEIMYPGSISTSEQQQLQQPMIQYDENVRQ
jgi:hypothetical protein